MKKDNLNIPIRNMETESVLKSDMKEKASIKKSLIKENVSWLQHYILSNI